jgi:hypothetical protein
LPLAEGIVLIKYLPENQSYSPAIKENMVIGPDKVPLGGFQLASGDLGKRRGGKVETSPPVFAKQGPDTGSLLILGDPPHIPFDEGMLD